MRIQRGSLPKECVDSPMIFESFGVLFIGAIFCDGSFFRGSRFFRMSFDMARPAKVVDKAHLRRAGYGEKPGHWKLICWGYSRRNVGQVEVGTLVQQAAIFGAEIELWS